MSLNKKIAHNTIIQIVGKIISTILGLIAIGMLARYLGQERFGWYITAISFLQFIGIVIDFGLIPVTSQMMSEKKFDKTKLFQNLLGFRFLSSVLFLSLAPLIVLFFPYPAEVKIAISVLVLGFVAVSMNQVLIGFYQEKLKMHIQALGEVVGKIILVVGLWLLISKNANFLPIMALITISSISYTAVLWIRAFRENTATLRFDWHIWKAIIQKSWPIAISIVFNVVYLRGDILLLSIFKSQAEVGSYGASYRILDVVAQTAMMIMGVLLPILAYNWSRNLKKKFSYRLQMSFDTMMVFAIPITVGIIALAEPIISLVVGANFTDSVFLLQILSLAVFGVYLGAVFGHTAVAINKQKQVMWIYISNAVITLTGYLIFIPKFGAFGAAWMTVFSEFYAGILLAIVIWRYTKVRIKLGTFMKAILSSAVMAVVILSLQDLNIIFLVLIGSSIYFATLYILGGFSKETVKEIISLKK
ncbi:MAG: flippase [Candidatus Magasanikbacteria bacterium]|nr:flippase [Candidatus Magasanikbacteria bacterium]